MEPRRDNRGVRDEFFLPESTVARAAAAQRRPPGPPRKTGSRLAWLLCVSLVAALAGVGVWVVEPMRRALLAARAAQAGAVAEVRRLQNERDAVASRAVHAPPPPPAAAPTSDDARWAEAARHVLADALREDAAAGTARVHTERGHVLVELVPEPWPGGAPSVQLHRLTAAIAHTLALDESPYRLVLYVPAQRPVPGDAEPAAAAARGPGRRRRGRGRHAHKAPSPPSRATPATLAAERAAGLVQYLASQVAQRPASELEGAFGVVASAQAPTFALQLRLERRAEAVHPAP